MGRDLGAVGDKFGGGRSEAVVGVQVQYEVEVYAAVLGLDDRGGAVDVLDGGGDFGAVGDEVGLVEEEDVGAGDLFHGLVDEGGVLIVGGADLGEAVLGVDDGDDAVEVEVAAELFVHPEDGGHRGGIGQT